jgi:hypothetical protein
MVKLLRCWPVQDVLHSLRGELTAVARGGAFSVQPFGNRVSTLTRVSLYLGAVHEKGALTMKWLKHRYGKNSKVITFFKV